MSSSFAQLAIGVADRSADAIRAEIWRDVNAVGRWLVVLDNTGGTYNGVFDVQNQFLIDVNAIGTTLMQGRVDSSPAVSLAGIDGADIFRELIAIHGVDQMQDFMFHNDFDYFYPNVAQDLDSILWDLIGAIPRIASNITYGAAVGTPVVGAIEFREGTSFLSTLQEMFRSGDWLFYVDDVLALQSFPPGNRPMGVGSDVVCQLGNANNNVLGQVEFTERDGGKLYNRIRLYGKNPSFDAWTEQNAGSWGFVFAGADDAATVRVGSYSQVAWNNPAGNLRLQHNISAPFLNYASFDLSKGRIGAWCLYDNTAGAPGAPPAGAAPGNLRVELNLIDLNGRFVRFFGPQIVPGVYTKRSGGSRIYEDEWGWCEWNMGEEVQGAVAALADAWFQGGPAGVFDWTQVTDIEFWLPRASLAGNEPSHFYLDGLTFPVPPIARSPLIAAEPTASQNAYRVRPLILNMPNIRTQNALDAKSASLLAHHDSTGINWVKFTIIGNALFRYAGQSFDIFIPDLGIDDGGGGPLVYYATSIHHIIEPRVDVSGGFGYDWITEVEAVPTGTKAYDHGRLGPRAVLSSYQVGMNAGTGERVK